MKKEERLAAILASQRKKSARNPQKGVVWVVWGGWDGVGGGGGGGGGMNGFVWTSLPCAISVLKLAAPLRDHEGPGLSQ